MSYTEDCEIYLVQRGYNTDKMTNQEIRDLVAEIFENIVEDE